MITHGRKASLSWMRLEKCRGRWRRSCCGWASTSHWRRPERCLQPNRPDNTVDLLSSEIHDSTSLHTTLKCSFVFCEMQQEAYLNCCIFSVFWKSAVSSDVVVHYGQWSPLEFENSQSNFNLRFSVSLCSLPNTSLYGDHFVKSNINILIWTINICAVGMGYTVLSFRFGPILPHFHYWSTSWWRWVVIEQWGRWQCVVGERMVLMTLRFFMKVMHLSWIRVRNYDFYEVVCHLCTYAPHLPEMTSMN